MAIPYTKYVDITSKVAGGAGPAQSFSGRVFTLDAGNKISGANFVASTAKEVFDFFGPGDEYDFAVKYFGVITPSPANKPNELQFYKKGSEDSMLEAWSAAQAHSNSYGSCYFLAGAQGSIQEIEAVAAAVAAENVKHIFYVRVEDGDIESYEPALIDIPSTGMVYESAGATDEDLAFLPMGLQAATNWSAKNATMNYMYRRAPGAIPQVDDNATAQALDASRINYYGTTRRAGVDESFFQRGYLCGNNEALQDISVHAGEQWLKARAEQLFFDLLLSTRGIPANLDGIARGNAVLAQVKKEGLHNGVIVRGKPLSVTQKIAISDLSGDELAWAEVQNGGAWSDVKIVEHTGPSGIAEYRLDYVLIYSKGDWVRKVVGSHNLI